MSKSFKKSYAYYTLPYYVFLERKFIPQSMFFRVLLQGADVVLAFGRRYGLCGRNGLGKTTLLRMISKLVHIAVCLLD